MAIKNWGGSGTRSTLLGDIKIGIKVKNEKGVEYPKALDHFLCPDEVLAATLALAEERGDLENAEKARAGKPTTLYVTFPFGSIERILPHNFKYYGSSTGLKCMGDGEEILRRAGDHNSDPPGVMNGRSMLTFKSEPCDRLSCPHAQTSKRMYRDQEMVVPAPCQPRGYLHFIVWNVFRSGVYRLGMSKLAIIQALGQFEMAEDMFWRFSNLPYLLHLTQKNEQTPNGMKQLYVPWLEVDPQYIEQNIALTKKRLLVERPLRANRIRDAHPPAMQLVNGNTGELLDVDDNGVVYDEDEWLEEAQAEKPLTAKEATDELFGDYDGDKDAKPPEAEVTEKAQPAAQQLSKRWPAAVEHICETTGFYIKDGKPNEFLMLMVAMQYGLGEITDKNIEQVVANLLEHAAQEGEK